MGDTELVAKLAAIEAHYHDLIRCLDKEVMVEVADLKAEISDVKTEIKAAKKSLFRAAWVIFVTVLALLANRYPNIAALVSTIKGM